MKKLSLFNIIIEPINKSILSIETLNILFTDYVLHIAIIGIILLIILIGIVLLFIINN